MIMHISQKNATKCLSWGLTLWFTGIHFFDFFKHWGVVVVCGLVVFCLFFVVFPLPPPSKEI